MCELNWIIQLSALSTETSATSASLIKKELSENRNFFSPKINIIRNTYKEKIPEELACFLFTTQTSLSSNSHCILNSYIIVPTNGNVTNIHNFDSETQLLFIHNDQIGTVNQLSNHHELENHVHGKTCAVHFMRIHACAQASFALYFSIEETELRLFTFQIFAMVPKLTAQN